MKKLIFLLAVAVVLTLVVNTVDGARKIPTRPKYKAFQKVVRHLWRMCLNGTLLWGGLRNLCIDTLQLSPETESMAQSMIDSGSMFSMIQPRAFNPLARGALPGGSSFEAVDTTFTFTTTPAPGPSGAPKVRKKVRATKAMKLAKAARKAAKQARQNGQVVIGNGPTTLLPQPTTAAGGDTTTAPPIVFGGRMPIGFPGK